VISEPEIKTVSLTYEDDFLVVGSDGLFDVMKDSEVSFFVRRVSKEEGREEVAGRLVEEARRVASMDSDDVSCIVVFLCCLGL
jgi:serine/threonine protein phosphatase PrpC